MKRFGLHALLLGALLISCAPQPPTTGGAPAPAASQAAEQRDEAQILKVGTALFPNTYGPEDSPSIFYMFLPMFDTLTRFGQNFEVQPSVATKWTLSPDRLTWIFTIREDLTFSNGDKLTADDVAYSFNTALKDNWQSKPYFVTATGATAANPTTVNVSVSAPDASIPNGVASLWIIPKKYHEAVGAAGFREKPIGSGPYERIEMKPQDSARFRKRTTAHPFRPIANNEIVFTRISDNQQRINGLATGEIDIASQSNFTGDQANKLKSDGMDVRTQTTATLLLSIPAGTYETRGTALANLKVRQALNYAINRTLLNDAVYKGFGKTSGQLGIPGSLYYNDAVPAWPYDVAKAKALLAEAGYANGLKITIDWSASSGPQEVILAVQAAFKDIGVEAEIKTLETAQVVDYYLGNNGIVKDDLFPLSSFDITGWGPRGTFTCGRPAGAPPAAQFYCNQEHDRLITAAVNEADPAKARALMGQAAQLAASEAPAVFLVAFPNFIVATPKIKGMTIQAPHQYSFDSAYKIK